MKQIDTIIIFGCTNLVLELLHILNLLEGNKEICFYDNDTEKQGKVWNGSIVYTKDQLYQSVHTSLFVLASINFFEEMKNQLFLLGVEEDRILYPSKILNKQREIDREVIKKRNPKKTLNFLVDLAEHCNLNCQNCDHFSPLAKEHYTDKKIFEKDMKRISELLENKISHVDLEGGEPLLNPDIVQYIRIVHKYLPNTQIQIFTNGILLEKMKQEFWEICNSCRVILEVTKYPIDFDYNRTKELAEKNGVLFRFFSGDVVVKTSMHKPLDLKGKQDKYKSFQACYMANGDCAMLKNGKLYGCTLLPNLETFNKYYNQDLKVTDKDYIDLYMDITADDIFDFLCNPMPGCRYCKVGEWTYNHKWQISQRKIEEWT